MLSYLADWLDIVQPTSIEVDVVAARGERLAVTEFLAVTADGDEIVKLDLYRMTSDLDLLELCVSYEPEHLDEVLAELDRQHSALIGHDEN